MTSYTVLRRPGRRSLYVETQALWRFGWILGLVFEQGKRRIERNTQKIEREPLDLRTRIKRLARKTICFSKLERMRDIVIGLCIHRFEFGNAA